MRHAALVLVILASSMAWPARADRLDDDLNTVWEAVWDERGTPQPVVRWTQPIRYRWIGKEQGRERDTVVAALKAAAAAASLSLVAAADDDASANLELEFVSEQALGNAVGCIVNTRVHAAALTRVTLRLRASQAWQCAYHEAMHVMGIPGHPSGKTVLSYFPWRRDTLMALDTLMLAAWYDRQVPLGATPFQWLVAAGTRVARQDDLGLSPADAERRRQEHFAQRVAEMQAFAQGDGDVPLIVKRSGRASPGHIEQARTLQAHYLALAFTQGTGMQADGAQAVRWFTVAAQRDHALSQFMLALLLRKGLGVAQDLVEAHRWLSRAVISGNAAARTELEQLESAMDAAQLNKARALGPHVPRPATAPNS